MKKKFTLLVAALALLTMIVQPLKAVGQTKTSQTAFYGFESGDAGWTATSFVTNNTAITAHSGSKYGATNGGSTANVTFNTQVANPQSLTCYYSKTTTNTNAGSHFEIQVSTDNSTWTKVEEGLGMNNVTKGTWYELTADLSSYSDVYVRVYYTGTSAVRALDDITLVYDDGSSPSVDPVITFSPTSVTLEDVLVGQETSTTFSVSQANLTSGITLSVDNGELSSTSIDQGADPTSVTWTYTPSVAGNFSATATATSGTTTQTLEITGNAIAPVDGYDVDFEFATNMYPNWVFNNMTTQQSGGNQVTAHGGSYYGTTGGKATASITTAEPVENPGTLTCYVTKQSSNTTSSTWYIQVSDDGSTWEDVLTKDATSMAQGEWVDFSADLSAYSDVYVRVYYSGSTAVRNIDDLTLTTVEPSTNPSIAANNVGIAYDAENGSIAYSIINPVDGASLEAVVADGATIANFTLGTIVDSPITFTCDANTENTERTATVTLNYVKNNEQLATKDVTVTQAAAPVIYTSFADLLADATTTATSAYVHFNNWVISGANDSQHSFLTDGTNGCMIFGSEQGFAAGDVLTGTVQCKFQKYNNALELTQLNSETQGLTVTPGGTVSVADIEMANLQAINTGALVHYENLTCSITTGQYTNYYLTDGTTQIQVYQTLYNDLASSLEEGKVYNITGVFVQNNNTKRINPRSADDIVEVTIPSIAAEDLNIAYDATEGAITYTLENPVSGGLLTAAITAGNEGNWLTLSEEIGANVPFTCTANTGAERTATVTLTYTYNTTGIITATAVVTQAAYEAPIVASITLSTNAIEAPYTGADGIITVTYENITDVVAEVWFCDAAGENDANYDWMDAEINDDDNVYFYITENDGEARTAYFKVWAYDDDAEEVYSELVTVSQAAYVAPPAADNFELFSGDLVEGDYIIYYDGYAMKNVVSSSRLSYEIVTPENDVITTDDASIIWHIAQDGDYWTIYSEDKSQYAASTVSKNQATLIDDITDNARWTVTGTDSYEFENLARSTGTNPGNKWLRNNGTNGFACYSSSTGDALSLYKKVDNSPSISADNVNITYDATSGSIIYEINNYVAGTMVATTDADWISAFTYEQVDEIGSVGFTATANALYENRSATVTLTYTYEDSKATTTKDVTVTQAAAPTPTYYVEFDLAGGTFVSNSDFDDVIVEIEAGTYNLPSAIKDGFIFAGWDDGESIYEADAEYTVSDDVTFTAVYTGTPTYTVSFSVNGTIDDNLTQTVSSIDLPASSTLTPNGFEIVGWALEASTEAVANPYEPTTDVTLFALLQLENAPTPSENYVKVTEELTDWSGEYLIAYSDEIFADGRIGGTDNSGIGAKEVSVDLSSEISDNTISGSIGDTYKVVLEEISEGSKTYVLKTQDGKYNYQSSNSNGLLATDNKETAASYPISVTFTSANDIKLCLGGNAAGAVFRYNTNGYFRFYKNGGQSAVYLYKKESATPAVFNTVTEIKTTPDEPMTANIPATTCIVVNSGAVLTFNGQNNGTAANLIIEDGGQLINNSANPVAATVKKSITGYGNSKGGAGYLLVSSPIDNMDPVAAGMVTTTSDYDLYWFNQAQENEEWRNYKKAAFNLEIGKGYLYANTNTETLEFAGTIYAGNGEVTLSKESGVTFEGWNLVGNPFTQNAYPNKPFYIMNELGSEIVASEGNMVTPMQGIFVVAANDGDKVTFFKEPSSGNNKGGLALNVSQTVNTRGESHSNLVDRAIVRFGDNDMLPKFQLNDNSTKVYIPMNGKDYAVVSSEGQGEMPVCFKTAENGTYTISVKAMNLDMRYLHLIDHLTGANVDLLATPSYTFEARGTDMAARFKLVFSGSNSGTDENFAFISDGQLIVNGNGTLNVYDALGRIIVSTTAMQGVSTNNMTPGLYVLQLVNGNEVKTQKIIVK